MEYLASFTKLLILVCLVTATIQYDSRRLDGVSVPLRNPRILNAQIAAFDQFPYQVSVRVGTKHKCGGAIISQNYVLTAATCVYSFRSCQLKVQAGSVNRTAGGVIVAVSRIIPHEEYYYYNNDVALLKLKTSLEYSDVIQPIPIAAVSPPDGVNVVSSGWGRIREGAAFSDLLLYSRAFTTMKIADCSTYIGPEKPGVLCLAKTYQNGICDGDEGGPAVYQGILIGIASYQDVACSSSKPNIFSRVSYFRRWIIENSDLSSIIGG